MGDKLSGPLDLFALTFCNTFKTSFSVTDIKPRSGLQLSGITIPRSVCDVDVLKTEWKYLLKPSAWDLDVVSLIESDISSCGIDRWTVLVFTNDQNFFGFFAVQFSSSLIKPTYFDLHVLFVSSHGVASAIGSSSILSGALFLLLFLCTDGCPWVDTIASVESPSSAFQSTWFVVSCTRELPRSSLRDSRLADLDSSRLYPRVAVDSPRLMALSGVWNAESW